MIIWAPQRRDALHSPNVTECKRAIFDAELRTRAHDSVKTRNRARRLHAKPRKVLSRASLRARALLRAIFYTGITHHILCSQSIRDLLSPSL